MAIISKNGSRTDDIISYGTQKGGGIFGFVRALFWFLIANSPSFLLFFLFEYNMHLTLLAITAALFLITSSNAFSLDTSHHLARHQHIAARHPEVKRASASTRCQKRNSTPAAIPSSTPTTPPAPPSSPWPGKGKVGIAWPNGNAPYLKNFITEKVSVFVDFFFSSSSPYFFLLQHIQLEPW